MDIPFSRWHQAIEKRRSRRHFDPNLPIAPEALAALDKVCNQFAPFPQARSRLVTESAKGVFKGIIGSYGKVKDAPAFIAFIGDMDDPFVQEKVGYTGEGIILEATALVLGCRLFQTADRGLSYRSEQQRTSTGYNSSGLCAGV
jgi:hypothetical protein